MKYKWEKIRVKRQSRKRNKTPQTHSSVLSKGGVRHVSRVTVSISFLNNSWMMNIDHRDRRYIKRLRSSIHLVKLVNPSIKNLPV